MNRDQPKILSLLYRDGLVLETTNRTKKILLYVCDMNNTKENKIIQIYKEGKMVEEYLVDNIYCDKEGVYRKGVRNGFYKRYEFDKLVEEGNYKDGVKNGLWKKYHVSHYYYENDELLEEKHNVPNY